MKTHVFRLNPGQDLYLELQKYAVENKLEAAVVLTLIGSLSQLSLRLAAMKEVITLKEEFEILQVSGTISLNGLHLHGSFSKKEGSVIGGHLKAGCLIRTTAEVILVELSEWNFQRKLDEGTGYQELLPSRKP